MGVRCARADTVLSGEMVTGPNPEARINFLHPDTLYGFNVSAYSIAGESQHSEELIVHTLPAGPSLLVLLLLLLLLVVVVVVAVCVCVCVLGLCVFFFWGGGGGRGV